MLHENINKTFILLIILGILFSCTPSPRYQANYNKSKTLKQKKIKKKSNKTSTFNKNKMVYTGISSYYGHKFHGKLTANGEVFDMYGLTAAHKEMPFNTIVRVTNKNNGKSLIIRINDRGPYIDGRILDCSFGTAKKLGFVKEGITAVKIEVIEWGDGLYMHHE
tara:strand:+ start:3557 stop:4048 length:492 start_codon:yes stop_codon:yes gene_type:complete